MKYLSNEIRKGLMKTLSNGRVSDTSWSLSEEYRYLNVLLYFVWILNL